MFYFTPGSRYLRTVEHLIFGETYFGYVSLLLLLPFLVFCLFRRYFTARTALAIAPDLHRDTDRRAVRLDVLSFTSSMPRTVTATRPRPFFSLRGSSG